ncbi:hypothetical protein [Amycolatopsis pithecellobii]|uniref:MBL fold metallo-hydrolase n=1 Tax=Amycolatopsis pithecellobii TaxID=664692 RepID=A0A6N7Z120_9PSEU|nr:hypothetical protein [Amycolatopsis pithecellobii]MTD53194.1 hypothetical protein [Amycolatopsis pithecellobii]
MRTWRVGNFKVTEVQEFPVAAGLLDGLIAQATPEAAYHSVRLHSDGDSAFITGDFIHHPIQIARPDASARNRRAFHESFAGTDLLVLGTHFTGAGAGYLVEDGDGYRLVEAKSE